MNSSSGDTIEVRRTVNASRQTAFEAWTNPEHVRRWWHPTPTSTCTVCEIDLRPGGKYRLHFHASDDESTCKVQGEFREVTPPEKLVYTWNAETKIGAQRDALVTVQFNERGEQTELVITHSGLTEDNQRQGHSEGWEAMLDSFENHLAGAPGMSGAENFTMNLEFNAPAEKLYAALAAKEGVSNWWSRFCEGNSVVGDTLHFRFPKAGFFAKMRILRLTENQRVEWECVDSRHPKESGWSDLKDWVGTKLRFEVIEESDDTCRLKFEHAGLTPLLECHDSCSSSWAFYLNDSLRGYVESGAGKPYADDSEDNI